MLEWQTQKLSEAEIALTTSGVSKHIFLTNKVSRPESKFSKFSRGPLSRSFKIKMNITHDKHPFISKTPMHSRHTSNLQDLIIKNRTLTEKDLQNSSNSLASKPSGLLRTFSDRHASLDNSSVR
jgi:hypothetical protein